MHPTWRILVLSAASLATAASAHAADIGVVQLNSVDGQHNGSIEVDSGLGANLGTEVPIQCNYYLEGEIERGDLGRLRKTLRNTKSKIGNETPRLCLNSPGGSYTEGLDIARFLIREGIGTAVPARAICYSACSIIFMGGSYPWKGQLNRFLDVSAQLGFHAPFIPGLPEENYDADTVKQAFDEGVRAISALMKLGVGNRVKRFPPQLMEEMLDAGPTELFGIDTIGKAIRYRIHLSGANLTLAPTNRTFCNACINMNYGALESYGAGAETDLCASPGEIQSRKIDSGKRLTLQVAPRGGTCTIDISIKNDQVTRWTFIEDEKAEWDDGLELAFWYLYPPNTKLESLASDSDSSPQHAAKPQDKPEPRDATIGDNDASLETDIVTFVKNEYLGHGQQNYISPEVLFADRVRYYDRGTISRSKVFDARALYYRQWPARTYELIADSLKVDPRENGTIDVSFRYVFNVAKGAKKLSGVGITFLTLKQQNGVYKITRETGKVLRKF